MEREVHIICFGSQKRSDYMTPQDIGSVRSWTWNFHWKACIILKSHNSHNNIYVWKNYCTADMSGFWLIQDLWVNKTNCFLASLKQVSSLYLFQLQRTPLRKKKKQPILRYYFVHSDSGIILYPREKFFSRALCFYQRAGKRLKQYTSHLPDLIENGRKGKKVNSIF